MTVNSRKNTSKKRKGFTKLKPGEFRDNMPEPFHTKGEVDALFTSLPYYKAKEKEKQKKLSN